MATKGELSLGALTFPQSHPPPVPRTSHPSELPNIADTRLIGIIATEFTRLGSCITPTTMHSLPSISRVRFSFGFYCLPTHFRVAGPLLGAVVHHQQGRIRAHVESARLQQDRPGREGYRY